MSETELEGLRLLLARARNEIAKGSERTEARWEKEKQAKKQVRRDRRGWSPRTEAELTGSPQEAHAARKARNARDYRRRQREAKEPILLQKTRVAPASIAPDEVSKRLVSLSHWLAKPGHRQVKLRGRASEIMRSWVVYQACLKSQGRAPTLAEFAVAFSIHCHEPMTRSMAHNRIELLAVLEAEEGPWHTGGR